MFVLSSIPETPNEAPPRTALSRLEPEATRLLAAIAGHNLANHDPIRAV